MSENIEMQIFLMEMILQLKGKRNIIIAYKENSG